MAPTRLRYKPVLGSARAQRSVASLTRRSPASDRSVAALVTICQRLQELRQDDPLALARRLVDAADLADLGKCPLTNREMAEVLGISSISEPREAHRLAQASPSIA